MSGDTKSAPEAAATGRPAVSVCICTYRRPQGVQRCLESVEVTLQAFAGDVEVVVVDNDPDASAAPIVMGFAAGSSFPLRYFCEETSGVAFARNRCLAEARADWIAFIDDDERASPVWLRSLIEARDRHAADVVLGPVHPAPETSPPSWLKASGVLDRPSFPTGTAVHWGNGRTGNVLLNARMVAACGGFDPAFASSGGEDVRLFLELHRRAAARVVWCDEAAVHEDLPPQRLTARYQLSRAYYGGKTFVRVRALAEGPQGFVHWFVRALVALPCRAVVAVVVWPFNRGLSFVALRGVFGDLGKLAACLPDRRPRYAAQVSPNGEASA